MPRRDNRYPWVALAWLLILPAALMADEDEPVQPLTLEHMDAFFTELEGDWRGRAVTTPVGPRPYDIVFLRNASDQLEGAAHPGAAIHYWTFQREDGAIKLRFLTTFGGNRQPLRLKATTEQDNAVIFQATQPNFLRVHVKVLSSKATIRILLRGKPHVEIRLLKFEG